MMSPRMSYDMSSGGAEVPIITSSIGEVDEPGPTSPVRGGAGGVQNATAGAAENASNVAQRSISDRYSYRAAIYQTQTATSAATAVLDFF